MPGHEKSLKAIKEKGEILLQEPTGDKICKINLATTDIKEAIEDCQIIMLTIPGFAIESYAKLLADIVNEDQIILLNGAASMGCVRFINEAKKLGINKFKSVKEIFLLNFLHRNMIKKRRFNYADISDIRYPIRKCADQIGSGTKKCGYHI